MNGNITKNGIQKDLDWMEQTGIGGFQNFDANLFTPLVTDKKLVFMTPEWKDAFKFTTDLAHEKGLEMAIAGSPGWSVTGGPWVEPKDAMKKYVWSETIIEGGKAFSGQLMSPPGNTSTFQNAAPHTGFSMGDTEPTPLPQFYADAAVVAYKLPESYISIADLNPKVSSSGGRFTLSSLTDGNVDHGQFLPPAEVGQKTWVQYEFDVPQTFSSYSVVGAKIGELAVFQGMPNNRTLEVSTDGKTFTKVIDIPGNIVVQTTGTFAPVTSKYWRYTFTTLEPAPAGIAAMFGGPTDLKPEGTEVAEFTLHNIPYIDAFEDKAGFAPYTETASLAVGSDADAIALETVVNLTDNLQDDGSLQWDVPEGKWKIIRLGYSLTGRENHPASPEATGLEVDKLDEDAVRRYINHYLDLYKDATGNQLGEQGLGYMILDSYEAGHMNWTHDMATEFSARRGYDLMPWIPVLTGVVVKSREASEKFLWDFRKTIGEMIADNHYDVIGEELHKRGMQRYTESHENGRVYLADGMDVKRNADVPMSAMWTPGGLAPGTEEEVRSEGDIRESASVAHIYGKPYVAAESMTSIQNSFTWHPEKLKRTADMELASGLNRFVIHTSVHQPLDDKMPGFSLGPFGQYFTRQETWSGAGAKAWISYLSRSSYLLQQGHNVADILYLYGENDNVTHLTHVSLPDVGQGYEFDFVSATILKEAIAAEGGKLKAPSGNTYEMLQLDPATSLMTLSTLEKIKELASAGVKIKGAKPTGSPSLADDNKVFAKLADEVWDMDNVGAAVAIGVVKDVTVEGTEHEIRFRHRAQGEGHIYWLNNRDEMPTPAQIGFRVEGKVPKKWNPQTGEISDVTYVIKEGQTWVDLDFEPWDAFFVVFMDKAPSNSVTLPKANKKSILTLSGPWNVKFQENRGAPSATVFNQLQSWTTHADEGIKYFSGTASYEKHFSIDDLEAGAIYELDLGKVKNVAEVVVNGQVMGTVWKTPFVLDVTAALTSGDNSLKINVTNVWVNRLIGDATKNPEERITYTTMPFYRGDEPLLPSGLLGEVSLWKR
ncbi:DNA-binding protein [Muricauda sp. NBRC 101325]|nr:DNA-binding protein [Muricauda sp. NBRC 101325]